MHKSSCELESWLAISIIATCWQRCPIAIAALLGTGLEDDLLLAVIVRLISDQAVLVTGQLQTRLGGVKP